MNEIIQTKVDIKAVSKVDKEIARLEEVIVDINTSIKTLLGEKKKLQTIYFCDEEIIYELDEQYSSGRLRYELIVEINKTRMIAKAYTDAHNGVTFVANIEGNYEDNNTQFNIKTFDEAKQICRQWLANLIYSKYQEGN